MDAICLIIELLSWPLAAAMIGLSITRLFEDSMLEGLKEQLFIYGGHLFIIFICYLGYILPSRDEGIAVMSDATAAAQVATMLFETVFFVIQELKTKCKYNFLNK